MDTSNLNPQVQKLLEETGTTIKNEKDLLALSNVSVRELAKLYDALAKNLKESQPKRKEDVFRSWKDQVVEKYMEKTEVQQQKTSPASPPPKEQASPAPQKPVIAKEEKTPTAAASTAAPPPKAEKADDALPKKKVDDHQTPPTPTVEPQLATTAATTTVGELSPSQFEQAYSAATQLQTKRFNFESNATLQSIVNHFIQKARHLNVVKGDETVAPNATQHVVKMYNSTGDTLLQYSFHVTNDVDIHVEISMRSSAPAATSSASLDTTILELYSDVTPAITKSPRKMTAQDYFDNVLSKVDKISPFGVPFLSSEPVVLTDPDDDMHVECIKHIYRQHVILQYSITNKNEEMTVKNLKTENGFDEMTGLTKIEDLDSGVFVDHRGSSFVILKIGSMDSLPSGSISNLFNLESGDNHYQMKVENLGVDAMDFVLDYPNVSLPLEWDLLPEQGHDCTVDHAYRGSLQGMVDLVTSSSLFGVCGNTGTVIGDSNSHCVHFAGKLSTGVMILVKANVELRAEEQQATVTFNTRCQSPSASSCPGIIQGWLNRLDAAVQEHLKHEEDLNNPYFRDIFSNIAPLKKLGAPHCSKDPILLSKPDSDLIVRLIKHTWSENVVLHFECTNMNPSVDLENVAVECTTTEDLPLQFIVEAGLLPYNQPEHAFVALEKHIDALPVGTISNVISYQATQVDPHTGEQIGPTTDGKLTDLNDVEIKLTDYFSSRTSTDFETAWQELGTSNEQEKNYSISLSLQESVNLFVLQMTIPPLSSDSLTVSGTQHHLSFIARLHNGAEVLFKVRFESVDGLETKIVVNVRSEYDFLLDAPDHVMQQ